MVVAGALSQWVSSDDDALAWRIKGRGDWLGRIASGHGKDAFRS